MAADYFWVYRGYGDLYAIKQHAQDTCDIANMNMWRHAESADYNRVERVKILKVREQIDAEDLKKARKRREYQESDARTE